MGTEPSRQAIFLSSRNQLLISKRRYTTANPGIFEVQNCGAVLRDDFGYQEEQIGHLNPPAAAHAYLPLIATRRQLLAAVACSTNQQ